MAIWSYEVYTAECSYCEKVFMNDEEITSVTEMENALKDEGWKIVSSLYDTDCFCPECKKQTDKL